MTPQQCQHYSFIEESRKRALVQRLLTQQAMLLIRRAINTHIDPREDPDLKKYWKLISEDAQQMFISEINSWNLVAENKSDIAPTA